MKAMPWELTPSEQSEELKGAVALKNWRAPGAASPIPAISDNTAVSIAKLIPEDKTEHLVPARGMSQAHKDRARELRVNEKLTERQMDAVENMIETVKLQKADLTELADTDYSRYKVKHAELLDNLSTAYKNAAKDNNTFIADMARRSLEELVGEHGDTKALVSGVVSGAIGEGLARKALGPDISAAGDISPMAKPIGKFAEQTGEMLIGGGLIKKGVGAVAGRFVKAAPNIASKIIRGAGVAAGETGVLGTGLKEKENVLTSIGEGDFNKERVIEDAIKALEEGAEWAALGGIFGTLGGYVSTAQARRIESILSKRRGVSSEAFQEAVSPATEATKARAIIDKMKPSGVKEAASTMTEGHPLRDELITRSYAGTGQEITKETVGLPWLPPTPESGTAPLKGPISTIFTKTPHGSEAFSKLRATQAGHVRAASYEGNEIMNIFAEGLNQVPEQLRGAFLHAWRNPTARSLELLPEDLQQLIRKHPKAEVEAAMQAGAETGTAVQDALNTLQEQTKQAAIRAGIPVGEYFEKRPNWRLRSYKVYDPALDYKPEQAVKQRFMDMVKGHKAEIEGLEESARGKALDVAETTTGAPLRHFIDMPKGLQTSYDDWLSSEVDRFIEEIKIQSMGKPSLSIVAKSTTGGIKGVPQELLETRKDLSKEYRDLLGEVTDDAGILRGSIAKLNAIKAKSFTIEEASKIPGAFQEESELAIRRARGEIQEGTVFEQIPEDKQKFGNLAGKYTPVIVKGKGKDRVATALIDAVMNNRGIDWQKNSFMSAVNDVNSMWKTNQTVWSPFTHARNFPSNIAFAVFAGDIPGLGKNGMEALKKTISQVRTYLTKPGDMYKHPEFTDAVSRGAVGVEAQTELAEKMRLGMKLSETENQIVSDFMEKLNENPVLNTASGYVAKAVYSKLPLFMGSEQVAQVIKNPRLFAKSWDLIQSTPWAKLANRIYAAEDMFWKMNTYNRALLNGKTADEAAAAVLKYYPNYDDVPMAVHFLRHIPILGPFVTWRAESLRCLYSGLEDAAVELSQGNPYKMGQFLATFNSLNSMRKIFADQSGISDKAIAAMDKAAQVWNKGTIYLKDGGGNLRSINLQTYYPFLDVVVAFNIIRDNIKDLGTMITQLVDHIVGLDQMFYLDFARIVAGLPTSAGQQMTKEGAPALAWPSSALSQLRPEEKAAFGPGIVGSIERKFGGTRLGEAVRFAGKAMIPGMQIALPMGLEAVTGRPSGHYVSERYKRTERLIAEGQLDPMLMYMTFLGGRISSPNSAEEMNLKARGKKVVNTDYTTQPTAQQERMILDTKAAEKRREKAYQDVRVRKGEAALESDDRYLGADSLIAP